MIHADGWFAAWVRPTLLRCVGLMIRMATRNKNTGAKQ